MPAPVRKLLCRATPFVAARAQNNFVDNLTNEDIYDADLSYTFRVGPVVGKLSGYYAQFGRQVEQSAFYNDQQSTFTYLTMTDVQKQHYGVEAAFDVQATSNLSFLLLASVGDAKYTNNPLAQISYEGMNSTELARLNKVVNPVTKENMPLRVIADGMRVSSTPLTAVSLGANYSIKGWFFEQRPIIMTASTSVSLPTVDSTARTTAMDTSTLPRAQTPTVVRPTT